MIEVSSLTKTFDGKKVKAIDDFSTTFKPGITGLVGENGAGKSTLLRCLAAVLRPNNGSILVDGHPADSLEAKDNLFFLPDNPYGPNGYKIEGVYEFYSAFYRMNRETFDRIMSQLNLPHDRTIGGFSKGMRRQLFMAIALSMECDNILLDEAFDGLDPLIMEIIKGELGLLRKNPAKTIIISSHNISTIESLADKTIILYRGKASQDKETKDLGQELIKYQIITSSPINEEILKEKGFETVSVRQIGSIWNVVFKNRDGLEKDFKEKFNPSLFERIPMSPEEVVALEMLLARVGGEQHE